MTDSVPEHVDIRGDPPIIDDLEMLRGVASMHLGNGVYVHAAEALPDETYVAYLGVSIPTDTSAGASRAEITFLNYGPVGAAYVRPVEIDGDRYYEVDLPTRDDLEDGFLAREDHENDHRAAVIPPVVNQLEEWADDHADRTGDLHRGMALAFEVARREVTRRRDAAYTGERRWSRDDLANRIDLEER